MRYCTERKIQKEMNPAITGDTTQLEMIDVTELQSTTSTEMPTAAKPTIAPTMEWVVDTGQPRRLAISNQVPAASKDASIPYTSRSGVSVKRAGSTIPLRMVAVTSPPAR